MQATKVRSRYDDFQREAVNSILRDFLEKPNGRFLLVIPTGGGKTFTAVKAVNEMFHNHQLNPKEDTVLWVAHRTELVEQAKATFIRYQESNPDSSYFQRVTICMLSDMQKELADNPSIKLVVIDEAHHSAARSYLPAFKYETLGILGLTATPSRHDGAPLEFECESFSIGFPDLVQRGIVLRPEIRKVKGGKYSFSWDEGESGLEQLNNAERNLRIISELEAKHDDYKKIIIFVGTKNHVHDLFSSIKASNLGKYYESIAWITGDGNSRGEDRGVFVEKEKARKSSILINVNVFTEGYDDPAVNTVVMATPTKSKLVYMQAMGRAIRHDPNNEKKTAFIIEIDDDLPNIRYRIDNRWLYSEISDALEPAVIDRSFSTEKDLKDCLTDIYEEYNVDVTMRDQPEFDPNNRYSLILFKVYRDINTFSHVAVFENKANRLAVNSAFNFLSERMVAFRVATSWNAAFAMVGERRNQFGDARSQQLVYHAMGNSIADGQIEEASKPWITYVTFHYRPSNLPDEWISFTEGMINQEQILNRLRQRDFLNGDYVLKIPLPLASSIGLVVSNHEYIAVKAIIEGLDNIKTELGNLDHLQDCDNLLREAVFPLPQRHLVGLLTIVRDNSNYALLLQQI